MYSRMLLVVVFQEELQGQIRFCDALIYQKIKPLWKRGRNYKSLIIIIIVDIYIVLYTPEGRLKALKHTVFYARYGTKFELWDPFLLHSTMLWFTRCYGAICRQSSQEHRGWTPFLFDKYTGFFYVRYTTHGTNGLTSHPKAKQWLSVLLKDTSVIAGD